MQLRRSWTHKIQNPQKQSHEAQILLNQYKSLILERQSSPLRNLKLQAIRETNLNKVNVIKCQPKKNQTNNQTMLWSIKLKGQKASDLIIKERQKSQNFIFLRKNSSLKILNNRRSRNNKHLSQIQNMKSKRISSSAQFIRVTPYQSKARHKTSRSVKKSQQNQIFVTNVDLKVSGRKAPFRQTTDFLHHKAKLANHSNNQLVRYNSIRISPFQNYY